MINSGGGSVWSQRWRTTTSPGSPSRDLSVTCLLMDSSSTWLAKTSGRQSRFSRWVLVLAVFLVLVRITYLVVAVVCSSNFAFQSIVGVSVLIWYMTRNDSGHRAPTAVGGKENEKAIPTTTSSAVVGNLGGSTLFHVSPTLTVAKRGPSLTAVANVSGFRPSQRHKLRRGVTHPH